MGINGTRGASAEEKALWVKRYVKDLWTLEAIVKRYHRDRAIVRNSLIAAGVVLDRRSRLIGYVQASDL